MSVNVVKNIEFLSANKQFSPFLVVTDEWESRDERGRSDDSSTCPKSMYIIVKFAFIMVANKRRLRSAGSRRNDKLILTDRYHPSFLWNGSTYLSIKVNFECLNTNMLQAIISLI